MKIKFRTNDEEEFDIELKPCPFCGSEDIQLLHIGNYHTKSRKITIRCRNCRVEKTIAGISSENKLLIDDIVHWWNNRTQQ